MDQLLAMRAFIRIVETGTFSRAADSMTLPRTSVTRLLQQLEAHLGVRLLQRTTRQVTVTPDGAQYFEQAKRILGELEALDAATASARAGLRGRLRVDIGSVLANALVIPALPDFQVRYPELRLELGVSDRPVNLIREEVDCVIRGGPLSEASLTARKLAVLEYVTCASPRYLSQFGTPAAPGELARQHRLFSYFSPQSGRVLELRFERDGERLEVPGLASVAVNESTAHLTGLVQGLGIGQTFELIARPYLQSGALVRVLPDWSRPGLPLHVVYPSSRNVSARLRAFLEWISALFKSPPAIVPAIPRR